jgi:hypothetical protein
MRAKETTALPGQGSWHLAQGRHPAAEEEDALGTGISLGMTLPPPNGHQARGNLETGAFSKAFRSNI